MTIYKRKLKNGYKWRAVIRINGYPTISRSFDRKQEAEDWKQDTLVKIRTGTFNTLQYKNNHTFNDLIEVYTNSGHLDHQKSYQDTIRHLDYWSSRLGLYAIKLITTDLVTKERKHLQNTPTTKNTKRSNATVNRYFASLSACLSYAYKQLKWTSENPCLVLKKLKESNGRTRVLSNEETFKLLKACKSSTSTYLYPIVLIAITTGARKGEILTLKWDDIDFESKLAYLRETKNGRPRTIVLVDSVLNELHKLYDNKNPSKPLVFASKTAFGKIDIKKSWAKALTDAEITNFRFHDLRHTFATKAANLGASNLELQHMMGHKTLQMLQRYTHMDSNTTRKYNETISEKLHEQQ